MPRRFYRRLILRCYLCDSGGGTLIEPSCEQVVPAAWDHALDQHREHLHAIGDGILDRITVVSGGGTALLPAR